MSAQLQAAFERLRDRLPEPLAKDAEYTTQAGGKWVYGDGRGSRLEIGGHEIGARVPPPILAFALDLATDILDRIHYHERDER